VLRNLVIILRAIVLCLLSSCTVTPNVLIYDKDGALIVPDRETLRAVLSGYEWVTSKYQFQFQTPEGVIVLDDTVVEESPATAEAREYVIYGYVKQLGPGSYTIRVRFWSPDDPRPSEWSDPFKFKKEW